MNLLGGSRYVIYPLLDPVPSFVGGRNGGADMDHALCLVILLCIDHLHPQPLLIRLDVLR